MGCAYTHSTLRFLSSPTSLLPFSDSPPLQMDSEFRDFQLLAMATADDLIEHGNLTYLEALNTIDALQKEVKDLQDTVTATEYVPFYICQKCYDDAE